MLDDRQRAKVGIYGTNPKDYMPRLLQYADPASLPDFIGGTDTTADFVNEQGPWAAHMPKQVGPPPMPGPLSSAETWPAPPASLTSKHASRKSL